MIAVEDKLYSFRDDGSVLNTNFCLDIYNEDSELINTIDDNKYGSNQYKYLYDEENKIIYASMPYDGDDEISSLLLKIHIDTDEIESIDLKEDFPDTILEYKDIMILVIMILLETLEAR